MKNKETNPLRRCQLSRYLVLAISLIANSGLANLPDTENKDSYLSYNPSFGTVSVVGVAKKAMERKLSGLAAEIEARQSGIQFMEEAIKSECAAKSANRRIKGDWKQKITSKGSEIFADGSLQIYLTLNITDLIKFDAKLDRSLFETPNKHLVVFNLPKLPPGTAQCGSFSVELEGKEFEFFPTKVSAESKNTQTIPVSLVVGTGKTLRPASQADRDAIKGLNILNENNKYPILMPISGG